LSRPTGPKPRGRLRCSPLIANARRLPSMSRIGLNHRTMPMLPIRIHQRGATRASGVAFVHDALGSEYHVQFGRKELTMDTVAILNALRSERDRIVSALTALEGGSRGRAAGGGRRIGRRRTRRRLSAAARKRISQAAKARWAAVKKAGKKRL